MRPSVCWGGPLLQPGCTVVGLDAGQLEDPEPRRARCLTCCCTCLSCGRHYRVAIGLGSRQGREVAREGQHSVLLGGEGRASRRRDPWSCHSHLIRIALCRSYENEPTRRAIRSTRIRGRGHGSPFTGRQQKISSVWCLREDTFTTSMATRRTTVTATLPTYPPRYMAFYTATRKPLPNDAFAAEGWATGPAIAATRQTSKECASKTSV